MTQSRGLSRGAVASLRQRAPALFDFPPCDFQIDRQVLGNGPQSEVFGIRNLIANGEQTNDSPRVKPLQTLVLSHHARIPGTVHPVDPDGGERGPVP